MFRPLSNSDARVSVTTGNGKKFKDRWREVNASKRLCWSQCRDRVRGGGGRLAGGGKCQGQLESKVQDTLAYFSIKRKKRE